MIYIEIVGLNEAGKSTLARSLKYTLGERARLVSVSLAEITLSAARSVVVTESLSPLTRAFAYMSAHCEAYDTIAAGIDGIDYLIGDRGYACFYTYQSECPPQVIDELWSIAMRGIFADLLVFIDTPVEICQQRIARQRNPQRWTPSPYLFMKMCERGI